MLVLTQGRPTVTHAELVSMIEALGNIPPRNRSEIAARLQALARIDLRDTGEAATSPAIEPARRAES